MSSSNLVKIIAAFTGGIVVALGSALIYVKTTEKTPAQAFAQNAPPPQASPASTAPETLPDADSTLAVEPPKAAVKKAPKRQELAALGHRYRHNDETLPPVEEQTPVSPNPYTEQTTAETTAETAAQEPPAAPVPPVAPAEPPVRQPRTVTLPVGTNLVVRLGETLSTDHNYSGDTFRASLDAPIVIDGAIIADRGAKVLGRVVTAQRGGKVQGVSGMTLTLTEIATTDGQRLPVATETFDKQGPAGTGRDAAKIGGGAALGAIIGAIAGGGKGAGIGAGVGGAAGAGDVLLTRGKSVILPSESQLAFRLSAPATITERLN